MLRPVGLVGEEGRGSAAANCGGRPGQSVGQREEQALSRSVSVKMSSSHLFVWRKNIREKSRKLIKYMYLAASM